MQSGGVEPFELFLFIASLLWIQFYGIVAVILFRIGLLDDCDAKQTAPASLVSIVIAVCNEEAMVETTVRSLLAQRYPRFELIVVNDRSTDGTAGILERLSREESRIRVVTIDHLPEGWLGKVHALHRATEIATGEWILYTDGDIRFSDSSLAKGIGYATKHRLDHLAVAPRLLCESFPLKVLFLTFMLFLLYGARGPARFVSKKIAAGVGAFNLVRRSFLRKTEGWEWLRMEPADDVGLAVLVRKQGGRSRFLLSIKEVAVEWYTSVIEMARGLEKNSVGVASGYSMSRALVQFASLVVMSATPFVVPFYTDKTPLLFVWIVECFCFGIVALILVFRLKEKLSAILLIPFGYFAIASIYIRAAFFCTVRRGIVWRGTFYPVAELRKGRRVGV